MNNKYYADAYGPDLNALIGWDQGISDPLLFAVGDAVGDAVDDSVWDSGESGKLAATCGMTSDFRRLIFSGSVWQYE